MVRKTTTRKAAPKKTTAKTAKKPTAVKAKATTAKAAVPKPTTTPTLVVAAAEPVVAGPTVKKNVLIDRVVEASGIKKKDAKPVVEAMLRVMGDALSNGEELQVPPLGKVAIHRRKDLAKGEMLMLKLRRTGVSAMTAEEALAAKAAPD